MSKLPNISLFLAWEIKVYHFLLSCNYPQQHVWTFSKSIFVGTSTEGGQSIQRVRSRLKASLTGFEATRN